MGDIKCETCVKVLHSNLFIFSCVNCSSQFVSFDEILNHFEDHQLLQLKCLSDSNESDYLDGRDSFLELTDAADEEDTETFDIKLEDPESFGYLDWVSKSAIELSNNLFQCRICCKKIKTLSGLKGHLESHKRKDRKRKKRNNDDISKSDLPEESSKPVKLEPLVEIDEEYQDSKLDPKGMINHQSNRL